MRCFRLDLTAGHTAHLSGFNRKTINPPPQAGADEAIAEFPELHTIKNFV